MVSPADGCAVYCRRFAHQSICTITICAVVGLGLNGGDSSVFPQGADTYVGVRRRCGAHWRVGGLLAVVAADGGGEVDCVRFGVRPLCALAQLGRQPRAQRRRHAFCLTQTHTHAIGTGIGSVKNKTKQKWVHQLRLHHSPSDTYSLQP